MKRALFVITGAGLLGVLGACTRPPPPTVKAQDPVVRVVSPRAQLVTDYQDFTGRAKASDTVDIKARATGYLDKIHFTEGAKVVAGQPLFDLEPGTYATDLSRAKAVVAQADVVLANRQRDYDRVFGLSTTTAQERDAARADRDEAQATLEVAKTQVAQAQRLFDYTRLTAPKGGRIGRHLIDRGSLVQADTTLLATVVTTDPMHVYFDIDDRTDLRLKRVNAAAVLGAKVNLGLPDQDGFPDAGAGGFVGTVDFVDSQLTATTGTISVRAQVPNPNGVLTPNLFVRVRLPLGEAKTSILVPEEALFTDQGLRHVWVVNAKDEAEYRLVKAGLQVGTDVVVEAVPDKAGSGLAVGERVIVAGGQRVRKDMKVQVK